MPDPEPAPRILDAATARAVGTARCSREGDSVRVHARGYVDKVYANDPIPPIVRLLRSSPAVYVAQPSAHAGDAVAIHYSAPTGARLTLRRAHGTAVQQLADLPPATGRVPDQNLVAEGLHWPSTTVRVPADAPSGIWLVELKTGGDTATAPLVIRCARGARTPPVLVTASAATWLCYNSWGGRNRYRNTENGPASTRASHSVRRAASRVLSRAVPEVPRTRLKRRLGVDHSTTSWISHRLSWRRPWAATFDLQAAPEKLVLDHLAALDVKILAWLDREGVDYECVADVDLHRDATICAGRSAVLLAGHSEYWSTAMLQQVLTAHRTEGTWVLNLSGNTMYRRIDVHDDHAVNLADLVMALSGHDETELTGVRYSEAAYGTAAPYSVTEADHWVFAGTGVARANRFGEECLIANVPASGDDYDPTRPTTPDTMLAGAGAAGFEVDRLVRHRRAEFRVVARGDVRGSAHMVVKEPRGSAGGAFSASSITFGGSLLVDKTCSRIVGNVLARAGQSR